LDRSYVCDNVLGLGSDVRCGGTFWAALIAIAILIGVTFRTIWRAVLTKYPSWVEDVAVALSITVVFAPIVVTLNRYIGGDAARDAMSLGVAMLCTLAVATSIIAVRHAIQSDGRSDAVRKQPDRLLSRISGTERSRLARISSDNHHVRVVLQDGAEHRLLLRLRDAVLEVDQEPGMCVHRSHWVATAAIASVDQEGAREVVRLHCGEHVPVGPKYRANLVQAGFINE